MRRFTSEEEALRQLDMARFEVNGKKLIAPPDEFDRRAPYQPSESTAAAIDFLTEEFGYRCDL
jgi:hypothetical protein